MGFRRTEQHCDDGATRHGNISNADHPPLATAINIGPQCVSIYTNWTVY